jgi:hypothetical protein
MPDSAMEWRFSDGTIVRLGGVIIGTGPLAEKLREDLELLAAGRPVSVCVRPQPGGDDILDPADPYHVDSWTGHWQRFVDVTRVAEPTLARRAGGPSEPGVIY